MAIDLIEDLGTPLERLAPHVLQVPELPPTFADTTVKLVAAKKARVFVDKIAERMAFERGGTRLYEELLSKFDAFGSWEGGPTRAELEGIRRDELLHFQLLAEVMRAVGAEAKALTPTAEVADLCATGLRLVIADPRIDLRTSLEAILQAELVDNDCWQLLVKLALGYHEVQLAERFARCLDEERVHLTRVRAWHLAGIGAEAFGAPAALQLADPAPAPKTRVSFKRITTPRRRR